LVEGEGLGVVEGEEAFDEEERDVVDGFGLAGNAGVGGKVIDGTLDGLALSQGLNLNGLERTRSRM
jgi:hypothetical protein